MRILAAMAVGLAVLATASASHAQQDPTALLAEGGRAMTHDEVVALVVGRRLETPHPMGMIVNGSTVRIEWFYRDGSWSTPSDRIPYINGRYRFEGAQVCIQDRCRAFYRDRSGLVFSRSGSSNELEGPVRSEPIS